MRAQPHLTVAGPGLFSQPTMLYCDDAGNSATTDRVLRSLTELGFIQGVDFDHFRTRSSGYYTLVGMQASGAPSSLAGYETLLYDAGANRTPIFSGDSDSHDEELLQGWLNLGGKNALLAGDSLFWSMYSNATGLASRLGFGLNSRDISTLNGDSRDLRINPLTGNGVLPEDATWMVNALCPTGRSLDAIYPGAASVALASLDPAGQTGGTYSAAIAQTDSVLGNRIGMLPFSFRAVTTDPDNPVLGSPNFSARTLLLKHFLDWFGDSGSGLYSAVPEAKALALRVSPNPFNPRTTIQFDLPRAVAVTLDIYDIQGRRVRNLVNETMTAGLHNRVWNGRDSQGKQASSGLYFYRFRAGDQERLGKLTLLK